MTSLEGVSHLALRAAELGGSLSGDDRDWPLFTGVNGPEGRVLSCRTPTFTDTSGGLRVVSLSVTERVQGLYGFELEPEVRDWPDNLSDSDYRRVDEVCGLLAEKGTRLGGPWSDHLEGQVWELRVRLPDVAARVTYWCTPDGRIVLLTVFRKTRQHEQRQIDRAVKAQKICEQDHKGPATETYERQV